MIDALPYTNEWWKKYPNSKKTKFAAENIVAAVRDTILSEIPWRTTESLKQEIEKVNTNAVQSKAGAKIANIDTGSLSHSINKWDQLFGTNVDILTLDQARGSPGYKPLMGETNAEAMAAAEILIDYVAKMRTVVETEEFSGAADATWGVLKDFFKIVEDKAQFNRKAAQAVGKVSMQDYYGATAQLGQKALGEAVSGLLELDTPEKRMNMYKLLEYGNLLATDVEAIQEAREIFPT